MDPIQSIGGEWLQNGDPNQPCAIFQVGRMLLVVNEHGSVATAVAVSPTAFRILKGDGWQGGEPAELRDDRTLVWAGGGVWRR